MATKRKKTRSESGGVTIASGNVSDVYGDIVVGNNSIAVGGNVAGTFISGNVYYTYPKPSPIFGKGMWISQLERAESGNLQKIRTRAVAAKLSHLVIKVADGTNLFGSPELFTKLNQLLAEANIRLFGFHYVYGKDVRAESRTAIEILSTLPLDGYIIDAEAEFTSVDATRADELMARVHEKAGDGRLGLASFRYPSYQPLPWESLLREADFIMPQIYWENASNPAAQLQRSVSEFRTLKAEIPIIPIGSAYTTGTWKPKPDEINEFMESAYEMNLPGVGFWNWDTAGQPEHQDLWDAIANHIWDATRAGQKSTEAIPLASPSSRETSETSLAIPEPKLESRVLQIVHNDEVEGVNDKLGYTYFVDSFVQLIMDPGTRPPLTIGISGAWGAGKTFILSHVRDALIEKQGHPSKRALWKSKDRPAEVHVIKFNAWEYNAAESVWPSLVRKILDTMEEKAGYLNTWLTRARRNLTRQTLRSNWKFLPLTIITIAVFFTVFYLAHWNFNALLTLLGAIGISGVISLFQSLVGTPTAQWITNLFNERDYGKLIGYMDEIQEDIRELGKNLPEDTKIVIMIDDLDRCSPEKIVEVLEAIKLLLNFELFIVIMAVDSNVITRAVEKRYEKILAEAGRSGHVYLDKIIQIPFYIPEPSSAMVNEYLFSLLTAMDAQENQNDESPDHTRLNAMLIKSLDSPSEKEKTALLKILSTMNGLGLATYEAKKEKSFATLIWNIVSTYWPVSSYLIHQQFAVDLARNPALFSEQPPLFQLWKEVEQTADIQSRRLQLISDAPIQALESILTYCDSITAQDFALVLQEQKSYVISRTFNPAELEAFQLLSPYLIKNPRHIKRMVNTYSLIRILAARTPDGKIVTSDPEAVLKWLIVSAQWPATSRLMLSGFSDLLDNLHPGETLPENNNILSELHASVIEVFAKNEKLMAEVTRLDGDPDVLAKLVSTGHALSSKQLDLLRTYSINFNPVIESFIQQINLKSEEKDKQKEQV